MGFLANSASVVLVRPNTGHVCCTISLSGVQSGLNVVTRNVLSRFVVLAEDSGGERRFSLFILLVLMMASVTRSSG